MSLSFLGTLATYLVLFACASGIQFDENGHFRILHLTDLHFGEDAGFDVKTQNLMIYLIELSQPDLVVITGDIVSGYAWDGASQFFFQDNWRKFSWPFTVTKTPYALVLGNHDAEANQNREQILALDRTSPYSLTQFGPPNIRGSSNYILPVYSSYNTSYPSTIIWAFDTLDQGCSYMTSTWGCLETDEVAWYNQQSEYIKQQQGQVQGLGFLHIPPPEQMQMYNSWPTQNFKREYVSCPRVNTGFIDSVIKNNDIKTIFCGHDHNNDQGGLWYGVELTYGRKGGQGGYGPMKGLLRGGRVIDMQEYTDPITGKRKVSTTHFILQQDGTGIQNGEMSYAFFGFQDQCGIPSGSELKILQKIGQLLLLAVTVHILVILFYWSDLSKRRWI